MKRETTTKRKERNRRRTKLALDVFVFFFVRGPFTLETRKRSFCVWSIPKGHTNDVLILYPSLHATDYMLFENGPGRHAFCLFLSTLGRVYWRKVVALIAGK